MVNSISFDDGKVTLGGKLLPGILISATVGSEVEFSDAKEDGQSGKKKVAMGWTDADVSIVIDLLTDNDSDCYAKLTELDKTFKGHGTGGRPQVYEVRNRHTLARGIKKIVFSRLESSETDQDDIIRCTMQFQEYLPAIMKVEKAVASKTTPITTSSNPVLDETLTVDVKKGS